MSKDFVPYQCGSLCRSKDNILSLGFCVYRCGNVGFDSNGRINFVYQFFWPEAIPSAEFIHRTLDNEPFVAPVSSNWNNMFNLCYMNICESMNASLAKDCPSFDKAFKTAGLEK